MITNEQIEQFMAQVHRVGNYTVLTPEEIDDLETYVLGKKTK